MSRCGKNWSGKKASAPTLEKRHHKYFLRFSYTEEVILTKTPIKEQIICSVDLGINTDAVCTIMRADGTVLGKRVANIRHTEKDCGYPESVHGIRAGLHTMAPEVYSVTRRITVFAYSRQENDITVTCQHRIISEQDILSENS